MYFYPLSIISMKKIFRIPIAIILLLGVGFMYIIKNPELPISQTILTTFGVNITTKQPIAAIDITTCTSYFDGCNTCMVQSWVIGWCTRKYCEVTAKPKCLAYENTGIDLTNCISYFDGCNNCSVKNGKPDACTLMYCETPTQPKCNEYASGTVGNESAGLANPASTNCINNWWKLEILEGTWGQYGMCNLPDGTSCEERAYYRHECWKNIAWASSGNVGDEPIACTMEYVPVCASVQVQCIKAPCPPVEQTFGNKCTMNANKSATFLYDGECVAK